MHQWNFYKNVGALQVNYLPPSERNGKSYEGCFLLEVAPGIKGNEKAWDWSKKIKFAISVNDLTILSQCMIANKPIKLFHEYNEANKTLQFQPGEGKYADTWSLYFSDSTKSDKVMVPLTAGEFNLLLAAMRQMIPNMLGWQG